MTDSRSGWHALAGIIGSALLLGLYARGGIASVLGFVALVPWLLTLDARGSVWSTLLRGWLMSVAFVLAAFSWFAFAIAGYLGIPPVLALAVMVLAAPLLQPQVLALALVRRWAGMRHGRVLVALAAASAWVGCEWLWPKLLGDSLGHGLYPLAWMRQFADVAGVAGLSLVLILCNEAIALVIRRWRTGARQWMRPALAALVLPGLLLGYGGLRLSMLAPATDAASTPLRVGMVQSNIVDYDRLRVEIGAYQVVQRVLDTHLALSYPMASSGKVDALLWSETVYPTTFGQPKSEDGAAFDEKIVEFTRMTAVPLVFGTYDAGPQGEYNAAAFVDPQAGLLGFYRKTRLFFATEYLPQWMEALGLRRLLPWAGAWQPGAGARVLPLHLADGREIPVQALICLDDVDVGLAIGGARLGAQALLGMSNDSWFTRHPIGARLHLQVAAFRSIETRLPQARVTSNGHSAAIDATGRIVAQTGMDEQAVLVAELPVGPPPPTLMRALGDWLGKAALLFLAGLVVLAVRRRWWTSPGSLSAEDGVPALPATASAMAPVMRAVVVALQLFACVAVLWMGLAWLLGEAGQDRLLTQLRTFAWWVLLPELSAQALLLVHRVRLEVVEGGVRLRRIWRGSITLPSASAKTLLPWRLPLPGEGANLRVAAGSLALSGVDPGSLAQALSARASDLQKTPALLAARARHIARRRWLDHPAIKFVLFPLLPALPAFRLHQTITFGHTFGEALTYGWGAWWIALGLWWASWIVMMVLLAGALRVLVETACIVAARRTPGRLLQWRAGMEAFARWAYYLGVPAWLLWRLLLV